MKIVFPHNKESPLQYVRATLCYVEIFLKVFSEIVMIKKNERGSVLLWNRCLVFCLKM